MYSGEPNVAPVPRELVEARHPRDAEVDELQLIPARQEHVLGLQVSMHDAACVASREHGEELDEKRLGARDGKGSLAPDEIFQCAAVDVLHDERQPAVTLDEIVRRDDVLVAQGPHDLRLATEAFEAHSVGVGAGGAEA